MLRPGVTIALALGLGYAAPPHGLSAQAPAPRAVADLIPPNGLATRRDSFTVLVQGVELGWIQSSLERTADGYRYQERTRLGEFVEQDTEVTTDERLRTRAITQTGKVQGEETRIGLAVVGGRIRGSAVTPGPGGPRTVEIDTVMTEAALDDNLIQTVLPALPWETDSTFQLTTFNSGSGESHPVTLTNQGRDPVEIGGRETDCYRIRLEGGDQQVTFWVTVSGPRRLMRIVIANSPVEIVRASP